MKILGAILMAAGMGAAAESDLAEIGHVTVCMERGGRFAVFAAQEMAAKIFAGIGIRLDWDTHGRACAALPDSITISLAEGASDHDHPGALAYAAPFGRRQIVIFYDRVKARRQQPVYLAYVLVHEIAHVLQGTGQHSPSGIMKPSWDGRDEASILHNGLRFADDDVELIRQGFGHSTVALAAQ
jgi:hypothetical protein